MERKKTLFRVTAWSGEVNRSFPERVDLVEAKTHATAMAAQREKDPAIQPSQQSAGRRKRGCELLRW